MRPAHLGPFGKVENPNNLIPTQPITKNKKQMKKLADQIEADGQINETLKYVEKDGNKYLVDGHHRQQIAKTKNINKVPVEEVKLPFKGYKTEKDLEYSQY